MGVSWSSVEPRETIVLGPGEHFFAAPDWCVGYRVQLKGAGAATEAGPGEDGYAIIEMYDQPIAEPPNQEGER